MKINKPLIFGVLSAVTFFAFAKQEKVVQIFHNGEVIQEYAVSDIDYIEVNDLISAPEDVSASVSNNQITIKWNPVEGATYNVYRSPDNVNFTLLASELTETTFTDKTPLRGSNFYRVKAVVGDVESGYTTSAAATLTSNEMENGIYLGITGFNQTLYDYPVLQLTDTSADGFRNFIDGLTMKNGTLLYYSVDQALNTLQTTELPSDISTAAIVTFTDGLDQGSMMKDVPYDDDMDYLDALNRRIKNETVSGQPITAFSIGIRGKDVGDIDMFRANLSKLASSSENATEVSSMAEVNAKFQEIAAKLSQSNYIQTINLKMPGVSNGTLVRFTFDNVASAENSQIYIEGKFNLKERALEEVQYVGLTSTSGTKIKGTVEDIFVNFKFEGVKTDNDVLIKSEFTDEWTFITSNSSWQINSEFDKTENSDIVTEKSSAVIMLVLDCSSSLADDFARAQKNAKDFINTLVGTVSDPENPEENEPTIYSITPADLSLAVWKDGTRYFLTPDQYKTANLKGYTVEGLTVIQGSEKFVISLQDLHSNDITYFETAKLIYENIFPTENQGIIISARWSDINNAISNFNGDILNSSHAYYTSATERDDDGYTLCIKGRGGELKSTTYYNDGYYAYIPHIRGCQTLNNGKKIIWKDPDDLKVSVIIDNQRVFLNKEEYDNRYSEITKVEGVVVIAGGERFIIQLHDAQTDPIANVETTTSLYGDILPTAEQGIIISAKWYGINSAIETFGGDQLTAYYYTASTTRSDGYYSNIIYGKGGYITNLDDYISLYVRGVITLGE